MGVGVDGTEARERVTAGLVLVNGTPVWALLSDLGTPLLYLCLWRREEIPRGKGMAVIYY